METINRVKEMSLYSMQQLLLYVAEKAKDIHSGIKLVRHLIDSGQAMKQYLKMGCSDDDT